MRLRIDTVSTDLTEVMNVALGSIASGLSTIKTFVRNFRH